MKKDEWFWIVIIILVIIIGLLYNNSIKEMDEKEKLTLILNRNSDKIDCFNNAMVDVHGNLADCGLFYWEYTADNLEAIKRSRDCYSNVILGMPDKRDECNSK